MFYILFNSTQYLKGIYKNNNDYIHSNRANQIRKLEKQTLTNKKVTALLI